MEDGSGTRFGRTLRELRRGHGLTLEELAEASGVSVRAISDMERGRSLRPQRGTVTALVQGLKLDEAAHSALLAAARASRPEVKPSASLMASPYTLPRGVRDFVGRQAELAVLRALAQQPAEDGTPPVAVVFGAPGSGKTTLAVRLAEELAPRLADKAFLLDMQGLDEQPLSAQEAMLRLLGAWGTAEIEVAQRSAEERLARYHAMAAGLQGILVLDNAGSESQVRPLLPRTGRLLVVVTSRRTLAGLEGVQRVELGSLAQQESASLLRAVVGAARVDAEPDAARVVAELCGHLPLAIRVAANWAATRTNWTLQRVATRLADEDRRLDALSAGDLRVNAAFSLSYSRLAPAAARLFRLLSLVPGPDFSMPLAAVLGETSLPDTEDVLEELLEAGLLTTYREDRYRFHDLLRLYARAQHRSEDDEQYSAAAGSRLRTWLLNTVIAAGHRYEAEDSAPLPDLGGLVILEDREQALRWIKAESDNWLAAFRSACESGDHTMVNAVGIAASAFPDNWVSWGHWAEIFVYAAQAAAELGEAALEARHRNQLAWVYWECERRHDDALNAAADALRIATAADSPIQQARAYLRLSVLQSAVGEAASAAENCRLAREYFAQAGETRRYLQASNVSIMLLHRAGRQREAIDTYEEVAAALADPRNDDRIPPDAREITALTARYHVSIVHLNLGDWAEAADALRDSGKQLDARGYHRIAAKAHLHRAHALAHLGDDAEAAAEYRNVLALADRIPAEILEEARSSLVALAADQLTPPTQFS